MQPTRFFLPALLVAIAGVAAEVPTMAARGRSTAMIFNVRDFGAVGDGVTLDTPAINRAIGACAQAGGGQVRFPPGRYLSGTVWLRSRLALYFDAGARLIGTTNLAEYRQPVVPAYMPEARWGKWHRALVLGQNVQEVTVAGPGIIDGNKVFDPTGEEHMRGPHAVLFVGCRDFIIRDVSIVDAANYAIYFEASDDIDVRNVKIVGGWDGVHFRGAPGHPCRHVTIIGCQFYTGDDAIAGRYWDGVLVSGCMVNSSCNGLRLIGPAQHLIVHDCLFYGPGLRPHRTSGPARRRNMLSGVILQPGAWDRTEGLLDDVLISDNTMHNVASPVTIWTQGNNPVGRITVERLDATEVYRSALSVESWSDAPITNVMLRDVNVEFAGGGTAAAAKQPVRGPGVDARPLPAWGVYARHVQRLSLQNVRLNVAKPDWRPVLRAEDVQELDLDGVRFTRVPGVTKPLVTTGVGKLNLRDTDPTVER